MNRHKTALWCAIACVLALFAANSHLRAEFKKGTKLRKTDDVRELVVELTVGAGSDELDEPVGLDLGLGFPFWLHPLGRDDRLEKSFSITIDNADGDQDFHYYLDAESQTVKAGDVLKHESDEPMLVQFHDGNDRVEKTLLNGEFHVGINTETKLWDLFPSEPSRIEEGPVPFGAIPQLSTAGKTLAPGKSASFTFQLKGDPAQDRFRTSAQLLDGIKVGDISRIGFIGRGQANWILAGYEIHINDELFAVNDEVDRGANDDHVDIRKRKVELAADAAELSQKISDLRALEDAALASPEEIKNLAGLVEELKPLSKSLKWLEGQIEASYPWFIESEFEQEQRSANLIKIRLETEDHKGADTRNHGYFRVGGRKYQIASFHRPLHHKLNPQVIELDPVAAPLTISDANDIALGMLANGFAYEDVPDRWHPKRVAVEVDGKVIYDSDEVKRDKESLKAICIIPPSHLDGDGQLVDNAKHSSREVFLWQPGSDLGIAPDAGTSPDNDPAKPEPSDEANSNPENSANNSNGNAQNGENNFQSDNGQYDGADWNSGNQDYGRPDPSNWGGSQNQQTPGTYATPLGLQLAVGNVGIAQGWRLDHEFTIRWDAFGDETQVAFYEVDLLAFSPQDPRPVGQSIIGGARRAAAGERRLQFIKIPQLPNNSNDSFYVIPRVFPQLADGSVGDPRFGAGRPIFPANIDITKYELELNSKYTYLHNTGNSGSDNVAFGVSPSKNLGVWSFSREASYLPFELEAPFLASKAIAHNVGFAKGKGDSRNSVELRLPKFTGKIRLQAQLGFVFRGAKPSDQTSVDVAYSINPIALASTNNSSNGVAILGQPSIAAFQNVAQCNGLSPMGAIDLVIDPQDGGKKIWELSVNFTVDVSKTDARPALFGVRVVPAK